MKNIHFFYIIFISCLSVSYSQKKWKGNIESLKDSNVAHRVPSGDYQMYFKNINTLDYFEDPKLKAEILKSEKQKDLKKCLFLIEKYVSKFGIRNFYMDTYMLWRLGQLYEKFGNISKTKSLYKLVLKHHRQDLKRVWVHYDSVMQLDKDYFVPIDYYYKMVDFRKDIDTLRPPHSVLLNMGPEVNSRDADYGPAVNQDRTLLLITSKRNKKGMDYLSNEDLFYCTGKDGYWNNAEEFKGINTELNEGSPCLTKDGGRLYFVRCNARDGYGNCDIYSADKDVDEYSGEVVWKNVKNLGSNVNSRAWDSQPSLSHTEDTLYFASDRLGGFGLSDIWFCIKNADDNWSSPQNMGPILNTRGSEVSPFFHPKFQVLYYSSNGHPNSFGDYDIYKVRQINGKWDEPRNIGPLVNGKGTEYYFTIDASSKDLYYAKSEENDIKNLDLYSFPLPMEAQPNSYTKLTGTLKVLKTEEEAKITQISADSLTQQDTVTAQIDSQIDPVFSQDLVKDPLPQNKIEPEIKSILNKEESKYKPAKGMISIIDLDHGIEVAPKFLREDGSFEFDLINNNRYMVVIQGDDFFSIEEELNLKNDTLIRIVTKMIDNRKPLVLDRIEFEHDSWAILPEMYKSLDLVMKFMLDNPMYKLKISGHTNSEGGADSNKKLSQKRAEAIKEYIESKGKINDNRIEAIGYGALRPLRMEITNEDKKINRRVEFDLIKPNE
ncbi:MAG: OmpA family protein [Cytophagales bacterium]|nr:MAG: OmpA family protein [Cytophagales bacterium]